MGFDNSHDIPGKGRVSAKNHYVCLISYPKQVVCCDGKLTKVQTVLKHQVASVGVEVWTPGDKYVCFTGKQKSLIYSVTSKPGKETFLSIDNL